jgi:hypothetical protein
LAALAAHIDGIGLLGPGFTGWESAKPVLIGTSSYAPLPTELPPPEGLPPAERRRVGRVVRLALGAGLQAVSMAEADPSTLPAVFTSSGGDGQNCHEICETLTSAERQISPTRFHNSVHNAAAGYWSIATRSVAPSNALCAFDASFAAGLLEALTQVAMEGGRVLLVAYDLPYPEPLNACRPIGDAFAVAFLLSNRSSRTSIARISASLSQQKPDRMRDERLESLRSCIPAARSLPLLKQLANGRAGRVAVEYLDRRALALEILG